MTPTTLLPLVAVLAVLAGCSGADPAAPPPAEDETSVFDPMTRNLERAKGVEAQVNQRVDELNKRLEESEGQ